jgi:hypothetical protein
MFKIFQFLNNNNQVRYNKRVARLYRSIFSTPEGEEVLADLLATGYVLESTEGDLLKEGHRKAILRILAILEYNPAKLQNMTKKILSSTNILEEDEDE